MCRRSEVTIELDADLLDRAKERAATNRQSLSEVVERALREKLANRPVRLTTVDGEGPFPGIDLDRTASLWDAVDGPAP